MSEDCFAALTAHGRRFDEGIKKLTETWRYPHNILGGYGAQPQQAELYMDDLKSDLSMLKKTIADDAKLRKAHMAEIDRFFDESQQMYESLVESCNDIETVLSEYGYVASENENSSNKLPTEVSVDSSLISSDVTDDLLEVEFTPDMTWRHRAKSSLSFKTSNS